MRGELQKFSENKNAFNKTNLDHSLEHGIPSSPIHREEHLV